MYEKMIFLLLIEKIEKSKAMQALLKSNAGVH